MFRESKTRYSGRYKQNECMISFETIKRLASITATMPSDSKECIQASNILRHTAVLSRKQHAIDSIPTRDEAKKSMRTAEVYRQRSAGSYKWWDNIKDIEIQKELSPSI